MKSIVLYIFALTMVFFLWFWWAPVEFKKEFKQWFGRFGLALAGAAAIIIFVFYVLSLNSWRLF